MKSLWNPIQEQNILSNTEEMKHEITLYQLPKFATRHAILLLTTSDTLKFDLQVFRSDYFMFQFKKTTG